MSRPTQHTAICLGCGCACDDVPVQIDSQRFTAVKTTCSLGRAWFRDGRLPEQVLCDGSRARLEEAVANAAEILFANPRRTLIYVADDLSCAGQKEATAVADRIGATVDGPTSDTVAEGLLAAQRRGRASATLGELRHRADVVIFWGVDPTERYPRFIERFVSGEPAFAASRTLIAVDVADARGPQACRERLTVSFVNEVDALTVARAALQKRVTSGAREEFSQFIELANRLTSEAKYVAIVFDSEPSERERNPGLAEALIAFAQALNGPTRAALFALRAGGNRNGLESLLTWQTGYPFAVDFSRGHPRYDADETVAERISRGRYDAALIIGSPQTMPGSVTKAFQKVPTVVIGPNATASSFAPRVAIDTGMAGIHEAGLVLRMDDVPLETKALLPHPHSVVAVLRMLTELAASQSVSIV